MGRTYLSGEVRRQVKIRAEGRCEYCLLPELFSDDTYHIDHIISISQQGNSELENLAYTCPACNFYKGPNLSAYLPRRKVIVNLYNPRLHQFSDHFVLLDTGQLNPVTEMAEGTIILLGLNSVEKVRERKRLLDIGYHLVV